MSTKISVLMYHAIEDDDTPCGSDDPSELIYVIDISTFSQHLDYLHAGGYRTVTALDILAKKSLPDKAVIIGFDDGHISNYSLAMPILKKYGFTAEVYVTTDWIGTPHYLSKKQIAALHQEGMVIGSHGTSHRFLSDLSHDEMLAELFESKNILSAIVGQPVEIFAAPGGRYNNETIDALKKLNYKVGYTSEIGVYTNRTDLLKIPRFAIKKNMEIEEFKKIIMQESVYIYKKILFTKILRAVKQLLGNNLYVRLRRKLLTQHYI